MGRIVASLLCFGTALFSQESAHYANARTSLKQAQLLMRVQQQPNVQLTLKSADDEVQAAIAELDRGAHTGGKDIAEHPGIDTSQITEVARLRGIVDLLHTARNEIGQEAADRSSDAWRTDALKHIASALEAVHRAAVDAHLDHQIDSF